MMKNRPGTIVEQLSEGSQDFNDDVPVETADVFGDLE